MMLKRLLEAALRTLFLVLVIVISLGVLFSLGEAFGERSAGVIGLAALYFAVYVTTEDE